MDGYCFIGAYVLICSGKKEAAQAWKFIFELGLNLREPQDLDSFCEREVVLTWYDDMIFGGINVFKKVRLDLRYMKHVQVFERLELI